MGTTLSDNGPFCQVCNTQITEYLGLGKKQGEGEWFCTKCDKSIADIVAEYEEAEEDAGSFYPGISWPPDWNCKSCSVNMRIVDYIYDATGWTLYGDVGWICGQCNV